MFRIGEVPADQLRGMLALKRSELERQLERDRLRLRLIESRIDGLEQHDPVETLDLRPKVLAPALWLSHRFDCADSAHAFHVAAEIADVAAAVAEPLPSPNVVAVYEDFTDADVDLEIGVLLDDEPTGEPILADGTPLSLSTLPRVEAITGVRRDLPQLNSGLYAGIGRWHDASMAGPVRELILQPPGTDQGTPPVIEVQFPIERRGQKPVAT